MIYKSRLIVMRVWYRELPLWLLLGWPKPKLAKNPKLVNKKCRLFEEYKKYYKNSGATWKHINVGGTFENSRNYIADNSLYHCGWHFLSNVKVQCFSSFFYTEPESSCWWNDVLGSGSVWWISHWTAKPLITIVTRTMHPGVFVLHHMSS